MTPHTKISPQYTVEHWIALRTRLNEPFERSAWEEAVAVAKDRISNRFLEPVRILLSHESGKKLGFGFAILALDCLLIDTLQSFREGRINDGEARPTHSFVEFLRNRQRFKVEFASRRTADKFVKRVRNGLLHDGETREGWLIRSGQPDNSKMLERTPGGGWIIYRNHFHEALEGEFSDYLAEVLAETAGTTLRSNFLLRMDSICG